MRSNFSVVVENVAVTPSLNVTWPLEVNVYVTESGGVIGKYLFASYNATIQVGAMPMPELHAEPGLIISITFLVATLMIGHKCSKRRRVGNI